MAIFRRHFHLALFYYLFIIRVSAVMVGVIFGNVSRTSGYPDGALCQKNLQQLWLWISRREIQSNKKFIRIQVWYQRCCIWLSELYPIVNKTFVKGEFRLKPSKPKYNEICKIDLESWKLLVDLILIILQKMLTMLLMLATGLRFLISSSACLGFCKSF